MSDGSSGTATVLFTDLVGSTELMASLGDAAFDGVRSEHFSALREALAAHRGTEVKNTGDGVLATFASAVDAVAAAVAMQQRTDGQARSSSTSLAIRVGMSIGEVAFDDGDVFGTPVVEAARLVAAARPGQILATTLLRAMAGTRAAATFTDIGTVTLKGLPEPMAVCEVAWEPVGDAAARLPLPVLLTGTGRIFVGREEELDRLGQLWKESREGERRIALVGGEPGVGKTRLAAELGAAVHRDGAVVLAGRCDEDLGVPYQPFVEALRHYVSHPGIARLGRHRGELARLAPELAQLFPGLPEPLRSDPETERYRLFDAVAAWLADASQATPVVLVLDDLQWAAKPTLLLLRHVLRSPEALSLLVVATYRDTDIGRGHPLVELLADLRRLEGAERVSLTGLDVPAVTALMEKAAGHELGEEGDELARVVWRETEGNAFFVAEVLRHLVESRAVHERDGRWILTAGIEDLGIPEGVRDVVGRRLSRLSEDANRVLACASVVGLEFEPALVQLAGGFSEDAILSAVEEAVSARLVFEVAGTVPRVRFGHALVRATLYEELTATRRMALHRRVAEAIEALHHARLDDHLPALAHHYARAAAPAADTVKAAEYATRAGDRALTQLAHDEAVSYYRQALELLTAAGGPTVEPRLHLLISLGEAERRAGDPAFRQTLLDAAALARAAGDTDALARAALANARGVLFSAAATIDDERVAVLEAALEAAGDRDTAVRASLLARLGLELHWSHPDRDRRVALSDEALAIARRLGDPGTLAAVLVSRYATIQAPDNLDERLANLDELEAVAGQLGDPLVTSQFWSLRFRAMMEVADVAEADRALEEFAKLAGELAQPPIDWMVSWPRTGRLVIAGRLAEAEQVSHQTLELGVTTGQADAQIIHVYSLLPIRFEQDRLAEFEPQFLEVSGRYDLNVVPLAFATRALIDCELGRTERARDTLEAMAASGFADCPLDVTWPVAIALWARVATRLGAAGSARILSDLLGPCRDRLAFIATFSLGTIAFHLGLLAATTGEFGVAESHFAAAAAIEARIGAPIWLARTRMEWARMLLQRGQDGDAGRARVLLRQALGTADDLGLPNLERHARALLEPAC